MKTENIVSAFRNASSPAARLAAWQNRPLFRRRDSLASYYDKTADLATRRKARLHASSPELSAPDAEHPLLWCSKDSPEIQDAFPGRDFLNHRGWYSDNYEEETLETYAIRLARFPRLLFYGVKDSCNGDFRIRLDEWEEIDFSEVDSEWRVGDAIQDAARSLVRSYDSTTEREAEESREFYRKDQVERDMGENRETLKSLRHEIRTLAHELKTLCPSHLASEYPAAGKALRDSLWGLLADRRELMETNSKLAAEL